MKLLLLSDLHETPFKEEKFKTQKKNFFEMIIQFFANLFAGKEKRMVKRIAEVVKEEGIKLGVFNGDFAEASRTERGMNTDRDLSVIKNMRDSMLAMLGLKSGEFNIGNHESGYNLPLCTDSEKGINSKAISNFLEFAGWKDSYHSFVAGGCKCVFVPYIFSEEHAKDFDMKAFQEEYLLSMNLDLSQDIPVILFVHDPDSFGNEELLELIRYHRSRVKMIFFGHYHSWINLLSMKVLGGIYVNDSLKALQLVLDYVFSKLAKGDMEIVHKLGEYFRARRNIPGIIKELGAILIPAPSGTFGIGGGYFYTLDIEKMELKKHD